MTAGSGARGGGRLPGALAGALVLGVLGIGARRLARNRHPSRDQRQAAQRQRIRGGMLTVWYDGGCPLCRREIALMRRLDRRHTITFVDAATEGSVCPRDRRERLERFHAEENGRMLSGAAAFAAMWRAITVLRPLGLVARNQTVLRVLEHLYRRFLRVRPALQRLACYAERRAS